MISFDSSNRPVLAGELAEVLARLLKTDPQAVAAAIVEVRLQPAREQQPTPSAPFNPPPPPAEQLSGDELTGLRKLLG